LPSNFRKVSKSKREYVIPFVGLKPGKHNFNFEVDNKFFEEIEYSIIHEGSAQVELVLEKKETMLIADFKISGNVSTNCDRCNDQVEVAIKGEYQLVFKFGGEHTDDETLVVLPSEAFEVDMQPHIYELITVSLPSRSIHKEGECNEEMLQKLNEYLVNSEEDEDWEDDDDWEDEDDDDSPDDSPWSILKNLN
jgi:uncharacterized protein